MKSIVSLLVGVVPLALATSIFAEDIFVSRAALTEYTPSDASLGKVFTIPLSAPAIARGSKCGHVMLELFMDVSAKDRNGYVNEAPVVEIYALTDGSTSFTSKALDKTRVMRRPVAVGEKRRVVIDITSLTSALVSGEKSSVVIAIGSLSGMEEGDFRVRSDILPGGAIARVYFDELSSAEQPTVRK